MEASKTPWESFHGSGEWQFFRAAPGFPTAFIQEAPLPLPRCVTLSADRFFHQQANHRPGAGPVDLIKNLARNWSWRSKNGGGVAQNGVKSTPSAPWRVLKELLFIASGENRGRRPIEPTRRRRWGVCGQSILIFSCDRALVRNAIMR